MEMEKNKGGRPVKEIDRQTFEELCKIQCTQEEICAVLQVDEKTLQKWCKKTYNLGFSQVFAQKRKDGKTSLRRKQWNLAETNATMAIWLGKQYLDQKDNVEVKHEGEQKVYIVDDIPSEGKEYVDEEDGAGED